MRREEEGVRDDAQASAPGSAFTWWGHSARACFTLTQSQNSKVKVTDSGNIPIKGMQFYEGVIFEVGRFGSEEDLGYKAVDLPNSKRCHIFNILHSLPEYLVVYRFRLKLCVASIATPSVQSRRRLSTAKRR